MRSGFIWFATGTNRAIMCTRQYTFKVTKPSQLLDQLRNSQLPSNKSAVFPA